MARLHRSTLVVSILILVIVLPLGLEGISLLLLSRAMTGDAAGVERTYEDILERYAPFLTEGEDITQAQREVLADIRRVRAGWREEAAPLDRLAGVTELQQALMQLFAYAERTPLGTSAELALLQGETGRTGLVQAPINSYNADAQRWNQALGRPTGTVYAWVLGLRPRPLLRFDGIVEFSTTISL